MKISVKEVMGGLAKESDLLHEIGEDEREKLKNVLIGMLAELLEGCKKHDINFFACGGTALGAYRHHGFIPWDDDVDIAMLRNDWEKFKKIFEPSFGDKYILEAPNYGEKDTKATWGKVYKKGTVLAEIQDINAPYCNGVFIDVFIIENVSDNKFVRAFDAKVSNFMKGVATSMVFFHYPNPMMKQFMSATFESKLYYYARCALGAAFSFVSHEKWCKLYDRFVSRHPDTTQMIAIPTGRKGYKGEMLSRDVWKPGKTLQFESLNLPVPFRVEEHLVSLFGNDYMQLPPVEKRERHYIVKCSF